MAAGRSELDMLPASSCMPVRTSIATTTCRRRKPSMNQKLRQGEEEKHHIRGINYQEDLNSQSFKRKVISPSRVVVEYAEYVP